MISSLWNWGFGNKDSIEIKEVEKKKKNPKKSVSFLNTLVSSVFGADIMEVSN